MYVQTLNSASLFCLQFYNRWAVREDSAMISVILSRIVIILFGTLYPAYSSYKAVKTKNVKEYVKWMMYWIVFALFTCAETFADIFISWLPFYYEIKILFVIWLMLPATKGASLIYRKFVHPQLSRREEEIDKCIAKASDQGYTTLLALGTKSFNYAANIVLATALKGQNTIVDQLKKSYSLNDLSKEDSMDTQTEDEGDNQVDNEDDELVQDVEDHEMSEVKQKVDESGKQTRSRRKQKQTDLDPLMEHEEASSFKEKRTRSKKNYDHTEVYHMGTLPRKTPLARAPINAKE